VLTASQLRALTTGQVVALGSGQVSALTTSQVRAEAPRRSAPDERSDSGGDDGSDSRARPAGHRVDLDIRGVRAVHRTDRGVDVEAGRALSTAVSFGATIAAIDTGALRG
jgi:hypothetical protein